MSDCPHCAAAQTRPFYGGYGAKCLGCNTRLLAKGPLFQRCERKRCISPAYRFVLSELFGADWLNGHDQVKAEAKRLKTLAAEQRRINA